MYGPMLRLELDVGEPWLDASGVADDVLLVNGVFVALEKFVNF